jgi:hypothetical protein
MVGTGRRAGPSPEDEPTWRYPRGTPPTVLAHPLNRGATNAVDTSSGPSLQVNTVTGVGDRTG